MQKELTSLSVLADIVGDGYTCTVLTVEQGTALDEALLSSGKVRMFDEDRPFHPLAGIAPRDAAKLISRVACMDGEPDHEYLWPGMLANCLPPAIELCHMAARCTGDPRLLGIESVAGVLDDRNRALGLTRRTEGSLPSMEALDRLWFRHADETRAGAMTTFAFGLGLVKGTFLGTGDAPLEERLLPESGSAVLAVRMSGEQAALTGSFLRLRALSEHWQRQKAGR